MGSIFGRISEEMPKYTLLKSVASSQVQIRRYAPNVAIKYDISARPSNADRNKDENGGFMKLAGYIGVGGRAQNSRGEAIAMTAPVVMTKDRKMEFILPESQFGDGIENNNVEKPPSPTNPDVHVVNRPEVLMAVKTFSGNWGDEAFDYQKNELMKILSTEKADEDGADLKSSFTIKTPLNVETYRYNPPWTISIWRTNEVAIELEEL